ncbi:hypothetical protein MXB_5700 [Myxobolus squamalis]|nr:hypothetical protein MXB_5700 [Myxobolus squamalis]
MLINRVNIKVEEGRELVFSNYMRCPIPIQKWFIAGKYDNEAKEYFINSVDCNKFAVWMNRSTNFTVATKTATYESFKIQHHKTGYTLDTTTFFNDIEQLISHYQNFPLPKENIYDQIYSLLIVPLSTPVWSKKELKDDHTRVILRDPPDDYINANYVEVDKLLQLKADFQSSPPAYILSQAPMKETEENHWQMIIQENITTIVLLTNFVEQKKEKCIKYWPDVNSEKFILNNKYCLMNVKEEVERDIIQIHLVLKNDAENTKKEILVLHYIAWPDYGVPKDCWGIIELLTLTNQRRDLGPPLSFLVHCSAGIGRTGTFIILDMILNKIKTEGISAVIDIKGSVLKARKQRALLVSSLGQYKFIHHSLMMYIEWRLGRGSFNICKKPRE